MDPEAGWGGGGGCAKRQRVLEEIMMLRKIKGMNLNLLLAELCKGPEIRDSL